MLQIVIERSFDWNLAITAAAGLVGAVIGSVATLAGQWVRDDRELRRHRVGTVRAVLGELRMNAVVIAATLPSHTSRDDVSSEVWRRSNHDIAQFLPQETYINLVSIYARLPIVRAVVPTGSTEQATENAFRALGGWIGDVVQVEREVLSLKYSADFRDQWSRLPSLQETFDKRLAKLKTSAEEREEQHHDETS